MKTVSDVIVDYLIGQGIEYIIGIPGHGCLPFFDAIRTRAARSEIRYIQVKQEMSAVHMADGYYRASGKPLAVFTSIGPGALNTAIGLGTAFVDSTPVLVFIGDAHTHMRGTGILQEVEKKHDSDILSCFRPISKRCWRIEHESQVPKIIKRAFQIMNSGRKGPAVIAMPMDLQAKGLDAPVMQFEPSNADPVSLASEAQVADACRLMLGAKRPVMLLGGGALYSRAYQETQELAELWGAAVVTTMAGKSAFPEDHPLYGFHGGSKGTDVGNYLCRTADVVLALGCRFSDETTSSYRKGITYNFPDTKLIHVDIDDGELGKNYPCDVAIKADLRAAARQLVAALKASGKSAAYEAGAYFADIQAAKSAWFNRLEDLRGAAGGLMTISKFLARLNTLYPQDGLLVTSSGNSQAQIFQEYCFRKPGTHVTSGGFSTMGFAFPAALGTKLAHPDAHVAAVLGDGDFMMTMQEMSTAKQYGIGVAVFLMNNAGWYAIRDLQCDVYGEESAFGSSFTDSAGATYTPDFCKAAGAFGIRSIKVTSEDGVDGAIKEALSMREPVLVEVMVTDEYPYSGGTATGWWDVPVPVYMREKEAAYKKNMEQECIW